MDVGNAKTRFFKRDSTKADNLTIRPHKEDEFWLWVASWGLFCTKPSDLGADFSDEGYDLPPIAVNWRELESDHTGAGTTRWGQDRMFRDTSLGIQDAAREKRSSMDARIEELCKIVGPKPAVFPGFDPPLDQWVVWCDLNDEQHAADKALTALGWRVASIYGAQDLEDREAILSEWKAGERDILLSKPVLLGSGVNLQQCHRAAFLGIGFKFNDFVQAFCEAASRAMAMPSLFDLIDEKVAV